MEKRIKVGNTYLIIDSRERSVIPFIETEFNDCIYVTKQVTTSDYLICRGESNTESTILAAIERKTYVDFAASFRDGRYENIKKMIALRAATGCQLYFFIEGTAFPDINRKFSRIPYSNILAAITKLMVRNGIFVVQTENEKHTAKRLHDFVQIFNTTEPEPIIVLVNTDEKLNSVDSNINQQNLDLYDYATALNEINISNPIPDILRVYTEPTDDDLAVTMWSRLKGISIVLGKIITKHFTVVDLVSKRISVETIKNLKTASNRRINKDAINSLLSIRSDSISNAVKILSGLRSITPSIATTILNATGGLLKMCSMTELQLSMILIPQKTRTTKFGNKKASRVLRILNYLDPLVSPALVSPTSVSPTFIESLTLLNITDEDLFAAFF